MWQLHNSRRMVVLRVVGVEAVGVWGPVVVERG
jgi:hypothetical protein